VIGALGMPALTHLVEIDRSSCIVCLENYEAACMIAVPPCKHVFHHLCLRQHLRTNTSEQDPSPCPYCRAPMKDVLPDFRAVTVADVRRPVKGAPARGRFPAREAMQHVRWEEIHDMEETREREERRVQEADRAAKDQAIEEAMADEAAAIIEAEWRSVREEQEREYAALLCHEQAASYEPCTPEVVQPPSAAAAALSPDSVRALRCARFESTAMQSPACKRTLLLPTAMGITAEVAVAVAVKVAVPAPTPTPTPTPPGIRAAAAASTALPAVGQSPTPTPPGLRAEPARSMIEEDSDGADDVDDDTDVEDDWSDSADEATSDQYSVEQIQQRRVEPRSGQYEYYVKWYCINYKCTPALIA
jgi:hypothetical protein